MSTLCPWPEDIAKGSALGAEAVARVELEALRRGAPVDTGRLRRSLKINAREALVFSDAPYAAAQNAFGPNRGWADKAVDAAHTAAEQAFYVAVDRALT